MTTVTFTTTSTPMGPFGWLSSPEGVLASGWTTDADYLVALAGLAGPVEHGEDDETAAAVHAFFGGDAGALDGVTVQQRGGAFITTAWAALRRIPVGRTRTYAELAADAGRPAATRAAASACATNRAALFVPCHRVLRTDGSLGGFRYGLQVKRAMLDFERGLGGR